MGHEHLVLLYWLSQILGRRVVPVANKQYYGIVFNQSNCDLKMLIEQLNGKLSHVNAIRRLKPFCVNFNITYEPSNVAPLTALFFNAYVLGLFDSNGTIYVPAERQVAKFSWANSDQLGLVERITSKNIRVCLGISAQAHLTFNIIGIDH